MARQVWRKIRQRKEDEESCFEERVRYGLPGKGAFEQRPKEATWLSGEGGSRQK